MQISQFRVRAPTRDSDPHDGDVFRRLDRPARLLIFSDEFHTAWDLDLGAFLDVHIPFPSAHGGAEHAIPPEGKVLQLASIVPVLRALRAKAAKRKAARRRRRRVSRRVSSSAAR